MIINRDINKARTLPSEFYTDTDIFEQSKNIFEKSAQLICLEKELENLTIYPFVYFPGLLDENLLITNKDHRKEFICISNVCTHRGHILASCNSEDKVLQCRYHGRTFNLDGSMKNAPGFKNTLEFPLDEDNLNKIPIFHWNNFLFISLDPNNKTIDMLSQIDDVLPTFPYSKLSFKPHKNEYIVDCHWTLYCDNYLEGFHIPYIHKGLNDNIDGKEYQTKILNEIILQIAPSNDSDSSIKYDGKNNIYAYYFFIFPNMMINYYKWGISINIIEPISKTKTRIKYMIYTLEGEKIPENSSSSVEAIELEDQEVVLSVQKGVQSRYYTSGRFSPKMEQGVHYFHRLISKKILKS